MATETQAVGFWQREAHEEAMKLRREARRLKLKAVLCLLGVRNLGELQQVGYWLLSTVEWMDEGEEECEWCERRG